MPLDILKQINWLDVCIIVLIARVLFISLKTGFTIELFKLLGTVSAVYLSLHYYFPLSNAAIKYLRADDSPAQVVYFAMIIILATIGYLFFVSLRHLFLHYVKLEATSSFDKWGGLVLGVGRAILLSSLVIFIVVLTNIGYFKSSVKDAYSQRYLFNAAPQTYTWIWSNVTSKFSGADKYNNDISRIEESRRTNEAR